MLWSGIPAAISVDSVNEKGDDWTGITHQNKQQTAYAPNLYSKVAVNRIEFGNRPPPPYRQAGNLFQKSTLTIWLSFINV